VYNAISKNLLAPCTKVEPSFIATNQGFRIPAANMILNTNTLLRTNTVSTYTPKFAE